MILVPNSLALKSGREIPSSSVVPGKTIGPTGEGPAEVQKTSVSRTKRVLQRHLESGLGSLGPVEAETPGFLLQTIVQLQVDHSPAIGGSPTPRIKYCELQYSLRRFVLQYHKSP